MYIEHEVLAVLDETLSLQGRTSSFNEETMLLGSLPEFDSMAVVTVVTTLEDRFDIIVEDDELDADVFETVGSLSRFVKAKLSEA